MNKRNSGLFSREGLRIGHGGDSLNHPSLPGSAGQGETFHKKKLPISGMEKSSTAPTHILRKHGKETLHTSEPEARKAAMAHPFDPGATISDMSGKILKRGERYESAVARELAESWWCGTPALEAKKKKDPAFTTEQPDRAGDWSVNATDKPVTEAEVKARKAPKTKKDKPNRVPDAKNEDPAMAHAKKIMKMANTVSGSLYAGPLDILAAAYAKHTFHPDNIGEEVIDERHQTRRYLDNKRASQGDFVHDNRSNPQVKKDLHKGLLQVAEPGSAVTFPTEKGWYKKGQSFSRRVARNTPYGGEAEFGEAIEQIVNKFLEDTTTGDVASMALGFAPTGEMDPHEGRPGKKKKKKGQFQELSKEVSGGSYGKLARKVAGTSGV